MRLQLSVTSARSRTLIDAKGPTRVFRSVGTKVYRRHSRNAWSEQWEVARRVPAPVRALLARAGSRPVEWTLSTKTARILPTC